MADYTINLTYDGGDVVADVIVDFVDAAGRPAGRISSTCVPTLGRGLYKSTGTATLNYSFEQMQGWRCWTAPKFTAGGALVSFAGLSFENIGNCSAQAIPLSGSMAGGGVIA